MRLNPKNRVEVVVEPPVPNLRRKYSSVNLTDFQTIDLQDPEFEKMLRVEKRLRWLRPHTIFNILTLEIYAYKSQTSKLCGVLNRGLRNRLFCLLPGVYERILQILSKYFLS